jgi:outer membrane protein OmpA-like peptidoglycan-associated protein
MSEPNTDGCDLQCPSNHSRPKRPFTRPPGLLALALALALSILCPREAQAVDGFEMTFLNPTPSQSSGSVGVHGARLLPQWDVELHLLGAYGWSPFALENESGALLGKLVSATTQGHFLAAVGLHERLELGIDLPLIANRAGDPVIGFRDTGLAEDHLGLGDLRIVPRILLWSSFEHDDDPSGAALTLVADTHLPTGDPDRFAGDDGFRADPRLALEIGFAGDHRLWFNVGYNIRPSAQAVGTFEIDNQVAVAVATDVRLVEHLHGFAEVDVAMTHSASISAADVPAELRAGLRFPFPAALLQVGGRVGLSGGATVPDWGFLASAGWRLDRAHRERTRDVDHDGVPDMLDACPEIAGVLEAPDGRHGCPIDSDGDGLADEDDTCPNQAGDAADGCPSDYDDDGVLGDDDRCPDVAGGPLDGCPIDTDGDEIADDDDLCIDHAGLPPTGCPPDTDGDGVHDGLDECPEEREDTDGFEDEDGCPDTDNDSDGFLDEADQCPHASGPDGGCPVPTALIFYFEFASAEIDAAAAVAIDEWLRSLEFLDLGEATMTVVGHTDALGDADYNADLSEMRAEAVVRAVRAAGIPAERTVVSGAASTRPAASEDSENGRAQNRRVEVHLSFPDEVTQ